MSFNASCTIPKGATAPEVDAALNAMEGNGQDDRAMERDDALSSACDVVAEVIDDGVLGSIDDYGFSVSVSGHVNAGHKAVPPEGADFLQISIMQVIPTA